MPGTQGCTHLPYGPGKQTLLMLPNYSRHRANTQAHHAEKYLPCDQMWSMTKRSLGKSPETSIFERNVFKNCQFNNDISRMAENSLPNKETSRTPCHSFGPVGCAHMHRDCGMVAM